MKPLTYSRFIFHYSFLIFLLATFDTLWSQTLSLPAECKFKIGDNIDWSYTNFNDSDWRTMQLGKSWEATGIPENVYAWYRIKFFIPSTIKAAVEKRNGLILHLGKIDDVDQTFFNGKLIGQTGSFPPKYKSMYNEQRSYKVAANEILWDKENLIAIRNFSPDNGGIGMWEGPYSFAPVQWPDFISIQQEITATNNNGFITKIKFLNKSNNSFNGTIKYWITDKTYKELFTESKLVKVMPGKSSESLIAFSNYQPKNESIFKVCYKVTEDSSGLSLKNEQIYLADRNIKIKVESEPKPIVENKIPDAFTSIAFQNEQLQGYLGKRLTQNLEERLLKIDENGIMAGYLKRPGNQPWIGEHVGKYLETACNVWKNTHDARLKSQMDRMMTELINSQLEDGYLGTYTPDQYWTSWDVWSHKYNLYGLLAYYTTTGYKPALDACKKIGDLLCKTFGNQSGQRDIILAGEHMGMAATSVLDPMVELFKYTGDKKYLDFCYYILDAWEQKNGPKIISALLTTGKVTKVGNGKAYEMLSNFVGLTKLYRLTGDEKLLKPVLIAWNDIVNNRLYITGSASSEEYFQDDQILPASAKDNIGEGCVTTTWIQFNQNLFAITGDVKFLEQIEKSIYNHLLGAENPQTGCVSYYTPLMDKKPYSCEITCCTSSVPRGIAMVPYFTLGNLKNIPTLMLYENALYKERIMTADRKNIDLSLKVETNFPEDGNVVINVNVSETAASSLAFRVPSWCDSFIAKIGDKIYKGIQSQYLMINRVWKSGEKINISFNMPVQEISGGKSYPGLIAFKRGPQVLAFDNTLNSDVFNKSSNEFIVNESEWKNLSNQLPKQWIGKQVYKVNAKNEKNIEINLVPFADASQTGGDIKVWLPVKTMGK